jgi:anaerobic sulfite reductase subunit A
MIHPSGTEDAGGEDERINTGRAFVYSYLSRAFKREIDQDFLDHLTDVGRAIKLLAGSQKSAELTKGAELLEAFMFSTAKMKANEKRALITDLKVEYTNLFLGIGEDTVHLVESSYLDKGRLRYEEPRQNARDAYQSLGFRKDSWFLEPEDHLALELEFMAMMCNWTAVTIGKKDFANAIAYLTLQKEFLRDRIMGWIPAMCKRLKRKARSDYYKSLAYLTDGFVTLDYGLPDLITATLKSKVLR